MESVGKGRRDCTRKFWKTRIVLHSWGYYIIECHIIKDILQRFSPKKAQLFKIRLTFYNNPLHFLFLNFFWHYTQLKNVCNLLNDFQCPHNFLLSHSLITHFGYILRTYYKVDASDWSLDKVLMSHFKHVYDKSIFSFQSNDTKKESRMG